MKTLPRVLIVDLSHKFGGASAKTITLIKRFPPQNVALAGLEHSPITKIIKKLGYKVHVLGSNKFDPRILPKLVRTIRHEDYQVVDTQNIQSKIWASLASLLLNFAFVSTLNSWYREEHGTANLKGKIYSWLELFTNWKLDRYIVVAKSIQTALIKEKIDPNIISLIYNAVDLDTSIINADKNRLQKKFKIPSDGTICSAVGRLVWAKGFSDLIDAFKIISEQTPNIYCLIVGDGELRQHLSGKIHNAGLDNRVFLLGFVPNHEDVLSIVKSSDIFILPSLQEGTPTVILEAAILETPILATTCGGIPELVTHQKHALLVSPGNPNQLAEGIQELTNSPLLQKKLKDNAKKRVTEVFNSNVLLEKSIEAYKLAWEARKFSTHR